MRRIVRKRAFIASLAFAVVMIMSSASAADGAPPRRRKPARCVDRGLGAYEAAAVDKVQAKYGPSGLLRDEIAGGAKAEVFASANMEHPMALAKAGKAGRSCCSPATGSARW